jgi:hypothetical protein
LAGAPGQRGATSRHPGRPDRGGAVPRGGVLTIQALGPSSLRVNGRGTRSASVGVGDEILIGPYWIQLTEPPPGRDAALLIELVQPLGDSLAADGTGPTAVDSLPSAGRRRLDRLFLVIVLGFWPRFRIVVYFYGSALSRGRSLCNAGLLTPIAMFGNRAQNCRIRTDFRGEMRHPPPGPICPVPDEVRPRLSWRGRSGHN